MTLYYASDHRVDSDECSVPFITYSNTQTQLHVLLSLKSDISNCRLNFESIEIKTNPFKTSNVSTSIRWWSSTRCTRTLSHVHQLDVCMSDHVGFRIEECLQCIHEMSIRHSIHSPISISSHEVPQSLWRRWRKRTKLLSNHLLSVGECHKTMHPRIPEPIRAPNHYRDRNDGHRQLFASRSNRPVDA